ncbi:hypothetical protein KP509_38G054400 [Ceratopteris richardii]|nr:hypothetical protein KP509_38G054400 [Ceratopteris richardii]
MTRRRSKKEEFEAGSTYTSIYGRSTSLTRSSPSRTSSFLHTTLTTSNRSGRTKQVAQNVDTGKNDEVDTPATAPPSQEDEDVSYLSYTALLQSPAASTPSPTNILADIDINQQIDFRGEKAHTVSAISLAENVHVASAIQAIQKLNDAEPNTQTEAPAYEIPLAKANRENAETAVPPLEVIKETKAGDQQENNIKVHSKSNQEVVKKIIRVCDDAEPPHQQRTTSKNQVIPQVKVPAAPSHQVFHTHGSRIQWLKKSGTQIVSHINERAVKKLRKLPSNCRLRFPRPSVRLLLGLFMCSILCIVCVGAVAYWYHLKKLEQQRAARKRWLW